MKRYQTIALFSLTLAATTGILLRFGLVMGMPTWAENYSAIRHAHSHLMYFGWVTLGLMALIWHYLPRLTGEQLPKGVRAQMGASALLALLSFPAFWANGYGLTQIGSAELPLGAMISGLNGILWLVFAAIYMRATRHLPTRPLPIQLWDWAIVLLLIAFGGALGLVGMVVADSSSIALQQLFLHLFLDLFAVGWFNLAILGLLWARVSEQASLPRWLPSQSLALCVAPTFLLGVSPAIVTDSLFWIAALANLATAALLTRHLFAFWQRRAELPAMAQFGLLALCVHVCGALLVIWPGFWQWSAGTQLRIFFLHNFLLGWVSSVLLGILCATGMILAGVKARLLTALWVGGVGLMLLALLALGFIQFVPIRAVTLFRIAAWSSIGPALAALWALGDPFIAQRPRSRVKQGAR